MTSTGVECPLCCADTTKPLSIKHVYDPALGRHVIAVVTIYLCDCGYVFTDVRRRNDQIAFKADTDEGAP